MSSFDSLRRQKFLKFTLLLLAMSVCVLIGTLLNTSVKAARDVTAPGATPLQVPPAVQLHNPFANIAKQLEPSVVNISSEYVQKETAAMQRRRGQQDGEDQGGGDQGNMEDLFKRFFGQQQPFNGPETGRGASVGTGFVVDPNGYIMTNNHVVEKANRIRVKFNGDQTLYDAKVIGTDWRTDLAVIKIDRSGLVPVKIGNSDAIQVGDWAIAIGSPFNFQETVTAGIISAKSRDIPGEPNTFQHFLQTDAAINPGNSGGPLLNANGEVVGINTQIATRSGGYQGIGFAMPINTAVKVYNQLIKSGKVTRGSIGVQFTPDGAQSSDLLRAFHAKQGVFVQSVTGGGPADKAGLRSQDIITSIGGQKILKSNDLIDIVADTPVGTSLDFVYLRDGKEEHAKVTVGDRDKIFPDEPGTPERASEGNEAPEAAQARFGITIQNLNDRMKQNQGIDPKENGVVVQSVEPGSFAEDMGLAQGDVITAIERQPVTNVDEFKRLQSALKAGDAVALRVLRNTGTAQKPSWQVFFPAGTVPAAGQ